MAGRRQSSIESKDHARRSVGAGPWTVDTDQTSLTGVKPMSSKEMRTARMSVVFGISLLIALNVSTGPSVAADRGVPKFDIERNCKAELAGNSGIGETLASCKADEEQARGELASQWDNFKPADRVTCIGETSSDGTPSYVELRTCLELTIPRK
jgi:hypothetical protein